MVYEHVYTAGCEFRSVRALSHCYPEIDPVTETVENRVIGSLNSRVRYTRWFCLNRDCHGCPSL